MLGCTDEEACFAAGINPSTLYRYIEKNEEFSERKETLKQRPIYKARQVVIDSLDEQDINTAHRVIDRKEGSKVKLDASVGVQVVIEGKDASV